MHHRAPVIALLTVSHGTSDPRGQEAVARFATAIHEKVDAEAAAHAFVDVQQPRLSTVLAELPADALIVIVPLLLSRGYHAGHDLPEAAVPYGDRVVIAPPLGPDPRLTDLLAQRLAEAGHHSDEPVVLAAAGSSDPAGIEDASRAAVLLGETRPGAVTVGFLSAAEPTVDQAVRDARRALPAGDCLAVASYVLAPGYFHDRVTGAVAERVTAPLLPPDAPPDDLLVEIALDRYSAALSAFDPAASDFAARGRRSSATAEPTSP
ncbi:sirohydrochlorin chelatase [Leifsonia sp. 2MCAF36]|uniref:sirohydrochlorin chelatase n=1 Tax=Leifsonia sp. 2MCAF36 TaxID=3232988 RepID=UPI003F96EE66